MSITKIILEKQNDDVLIVYHGTNNPERIDRAHELFASKSKRHADTYGSELFKLKLNLKNAKVWDGTNKEDIDKLFKNIKYLHDTYDDEYYYSSDEFWNSIKIDNSWEAIENTRDAIKWLKNNYDVIIITEGGYINYYIFDMELIIGKNKIN